ncbi:hypothetical protein [Sphingomonas sp.]|uniref:hypothetical protein n=1 Tax=Sphingomonas sp. TaxID=28214 RepID=UPI003CC55E2F
MKHLVAAAACAALLSTAAVVPLPTLNQAHATPPSGCRDGKDRRVRMINATRYTIERLFGSNTSRRTWEEDVLGERVLRPGDAVMVNWDDGTCACMFDFKANFSDGDNSIKHGVNVCRISRFRFVE